jgi:hypothetical protein
MFSIWLISSIAVALSLKIKLSTAFTDMRVVVGVTFSRSI